MGDHNNSPQRRYTGLHEMFHQRQLEVKLWIEDMVGERLVTGDNLGSALRDGRVLCKLINALHPGFIEKWCDTDPTPRHKMIENINVFLHRCRAMGVPEDKLFTAMDLFDNKNLPLVVDCLLSLKLTQTREPGSSLTGTGYFGHSSSNSISVNTSTGYFSSTPHTLPPPLANLPKPSAIIHTPSRMDIADFLRETIYDVKDYVLQPMFFCLAAGVGIMLGRSMYLKLVQLCVPWCGKSANISFKLILELVKQKLKTT